MALDKPQVHHDICTFGFGVELQDEVYLVPPEPLLSLCPITQVFDSVGVLLLHAGLHWGVAANQAVFIVYLTSKVLFTVY